MSFINQYTITYLWLVKTIAQATFATIKSVKAAGHKTPAAHSSEGHSRQRLILPFSSTLFRTASLTFLLCFSLIFGSGVRLLLPFLSTTTKSQYKMKSGLLLLNKIGFKNYYINAIAPLKTDNQHHASSNWM